MSRITSYNDSGNHKKAAETITSDQNMKAFSLDTSSKGGTFVNHNFYVTTVLGLWILKIYIKVVHNTSFSSVQKMAFVLQCYYKKRFC